MAHGLTGTSVNEAMLSLTDITTGNATASKHGWMPKLSGNATDSFRGDGTWAVAQGTVSRTLVSAPGTTAAAVAGTNYVYFVSGSGTGLTMPTAVGNTCLYFIKVTGSYAETISTTSSQTIDGTTTITIAAGDSVILISDGSNWGVF